MISKRPPSARTRIGSSTPFSLTEALSSERSPRSCRGCRGLGWRSSMGIIRPIASPLGRASWSTKWVSCRIRTVWGRPMRRGLDTFDDLLTEAVVLVGPARLWREAEDRLAVRRALFEADALGDGRVEDSTPEDLPHRLLDVAGFFCSRRRRHTRWPRDWSSDVCSSD